MSTKNSAGLESPERQDVPYHELVDADIDLSELIELHEKLDWTTVPGVSSAEAGAWTARLIEAREQVREDL